MFGFAIGAACLIGLGWMWRRARWRHWQGHAHGTCHGGHRGYGPGRWGYGSRRRGFGPVAWVLSRIEATPEQERVITGELESLFEKAAQLRREFRLSRDDVASAMRGESFDEEVMGESFARQDDELKQLRGTFVGALARIHDVLDERQRKRLADLLDSAPWRGFAPYRM
jgi:hypothetical protein